MHGAISQHQIWYRLFDMYDIAIYAKFDIAIRLNQSGVAASITRGAI